MGREENVAIFQDTERICNSNKRLKTAIKESVMKQKLILEKDPDNYKIDKKYEAPATIVVSNKRTLEAACAYKNQTVGILNFASATNPGGGVTRGSNAQEESICRCSTLYFDLNVPKMWEGFYTPHRNEHNPLHNDDCIYTPEVIVFKTDTSKPEVLPEQQWYSVNVVTCAAPNLRSKPENQMNPGDGNQETKISDTELLALHEKRLRRILNIAVAEGNEVIILGAFGCGAFENDPKIVAQASKMVIKEYLYQFKTIEFAIYCSPRDDSNFTVFDRVMR